jgi:Reverse transcriptase (RNA-dependent DNA polymerase)
MLIGAGTGEGINNTMKLHVTNFKEAMKTIDKNKWLEAVEIEHDRMIKNQVWTPVCMSKIGKDDKLMTTTWAMKKKANGTFGCRLNARGYEQVGGLHYNVDSTAPPVTNDTTIRIMYGLAVLATWKAYVVDVIGAFLNGQFEAGERLILMIPGSFEDKYGNNQVLQLNYNIRTKADSSGFLGGIR